MKAHLNFQSITEAELVYDLLNAHKESRLKLVAEAANKGDEAATRGYLKAVDTAQDIMDRMLGFSPRNT